MQLPPHLPEVAVVRVRTAGGPYRKGDVLSVAFTTPSVGRLAAHASEFPPFASSAIPSVVPESITVDVLMGAGPYEPGDRLTLSFIDPAVARIHPSEQRDGDDDGPTFARAPTRELTDAPGLPEDAVMLAAVAALEREPVSFDASADADVALALARLASDPELDPFVRDGSPEGAMPCGGVRVTLYWDVQRSQRFVRVVDKLFTVDRLGWYRHVFALRLLVPDEIATGDSSADLDAGRQLQALRVAVAHTLGRPLLAACMPNFCITPEWLDELDSVGAARAIAALRDAILPYVDDDADVVPQELDAHRTIGIVTRRELFASPPASVEALLPVLIPCLSPSPNITEKLGAYRGALVELFRQTAGSAEAVRLNAMSQPNHALDDRLWQLVGAVGESFGGFAAPS